ncbi:MaoC family dehydratase [Labedaea rhizosphaerae]|uniref:Acyl dehydratase n=1 Tax=Labedaea rhizosphaerae TaxID=598644 RepID=A0A4R6S6Z4_LABRH|nr:MaoC family dehydratase [Labedaea rhizosphaerae]TDP95114.1 acyl dehydratase [Labedaea rhizosphaerae]
MRVFESIDELVAAKGEQLGPTDWFEITQERVDTFADATDDHQWIHIDKERAEAGPFGTTIAHGYLTLSLIAHFGKALYRIKNLTMGINYGLNKVRFPAVVPVGSRLRASGEVLDVKPAAQGVQLFSRITIEIDGGDKPACVAETVSLLVP